MTELRLRIASSLAAVPPAAWDACAGAERHGGRRAEDLSSTCASTEISVPNPFISHAFLYSLEQSGAVGGHSGWQPHHLLLEDPREGLLACAPCYVKTHSRGEYVFDHGWADAFERAGGDYYPKLQVAVPFTPVTGPRLLARPGPLANDVRIALADALAEITRSNELSSSHVTFLTREEWVALGKRGYL